MAGRHVDLRLGPAAQPIKGSWTPSLSEYVSKRILAEYTPFPQLMRPKSFPTFEPTIAPGTGGGNVTEVPRKLTLRRAAPGKAG